MVYENVSLGSVLRTHFTSFPHCIKDMCNVWRCFCSQAYKEYFFWHPVNKGPEMQLHILQNRAEPPMTSYFKAWRVLQLRNDVVRP